MSDKNRTQGSRTEEVQQRKADVVRLKQEGRAFRDIATELGISRTYAHDLYWQAMAEIPAKSVQAIRESLNARLERWIEITEEVMHKKHVAHSGGKLVRDENGEVLEDNGPRLDAVREARQLVAELAKINGANAPTQVSIGGEIHFTVAGIDMDKLR